MTLFECKTCWLKFFIFIFLCLLFFYREVKRRSRKLFWQIQFILLSGKLWFRLLSRSNCFLQIIWFCVAVLHVHFLKWVNLFSIVNQWTLWRNTLPSTHYMTKTYSARKNLWKKCWRWCLMISFYIILFWMMKGPIGKRRFIAFIRCDSFDSTLTLCLHVRKDLQQDFQSLKKPDSRWNQILDQAKRKQV